MKPLPYRFPDHREIILRDAQRVRALAPEERLGALLNFLSEGEQLSSQAPNRDAALRVRLEQRIERRSILRQLLTRHGL